MAAQTNRQKAEQEAKSRQDSFDQYNKMQQASPEGGAAQLPSKATMSTVKNNISIAQNLEQKAKGSQINVPIPTVGTVVMNTISSMNYNNQAKALRGGGRAVYDSKGRGYDPMFPKQNYVGVVHQNALGHTVYSGRQGFSPIGRTDAQYNAETGTYTTSKMQQDSSSESSNNTPTNTQVAVKNRTDSTTSLDPKAKRSLLASSQGGTNTRYFIS
jgi:hypothetical protein